MDVHPLLQYYEAARATAATSSPARIGYDADVAAFRAARLALDSALRPAPQPIATAPQDGTMIWVLVDYGPEEADHPLADATRAWTLGFNDEANVGPGEGEWHLAGWSWSQDHFTAGRGTPIAWKPIGFDLDGDDVELPSQGAL